MVLSMAAIGVVVAGIYVFIPHDDTEQPVRAVDYSVELKTARRAASYPVAAPEGLSQAWKPTSVRFNGEDNDAWHLGIHTPNGEYAAVEQSAESPKRFIPRVTRDAEETKVTRQIGDASWQHYKGGRYDALVLREDGVTTVVTGTASVGQLAKVAKSLKTS